MEPNTTNTQGLTAQQMGQVAENNMKDRVLQESASNPGKIIKGAQMGALQTGTESTPVTFQAKTNPVPLTDRAPGLKESMATGTISSAPADAYVKTLQDELKDKEDALRKQANESEMAIFNQVKPEDQEALRYWEKGARTENTLNIAPPGFTDTVKKLRDEKIEPARAQMNEGQADAAATSRVNRIRSGQEGTGYGSASFTRQQTQFKRQQDAFAIQERDLLQDAWRSALSGQVKQAEELRNQADNTAKEREKAKADAAQARKDALAIDKMTLDNEKAGEDRVESTMKRMVETGYEPNDTQLKYLDEKYGLPEGTSQTFHAVAKLNKEKADAKDQAEKDEKVIDMNTKIATYLDKIPSGEMVKIGDATYFGTQGSGKVEIDENGIGRMLIIDQETGAMRVKTLPGKMGKAESGSFSVQYDEQTGEPYIFNNKTGQFVTSASEDYSINERWQEMIPDGSKGGQCGRFVNQLTGLGVGDSLESKVAKCDPELLKNPDSLQPGDTFVQSTNKPWGHIGLISEVNRLPNGRIQLTLKESNWNNDEKVTSTRTMYADDPRIKGFARTANKLPQDMISESYKPTSANARTPGASPRKLSADEKYQQDLNRDLERTRLTEQLKNELAIPEEQKKDLERKITTSFERGDKFQADPTVKANTEIKRQYSTMESALARMEENIVNKKSISTQDQAIITTFNKILDPGSVVREGEFARTAEGQSLIDRLSGKLNQISQGGSGSTPEVLRETALMAREFVTKSEKNFQDRVRKNVEDARIAKLDPRLIVGEANSPIVYAKGSDGETYEVSPQDDNYYEAFTTGKVSL